MSKYDVFQFDEEMLELWNSLKEKQRWNFLSVYAILQSDYRLYHQSPPMGVDTSYWKRKVISGFAAQPFFNMPQIKKRLYSGLISKSATLIPKNQRVKEHRYPRRAWLEWRLFSTDMIVTFEEFFRLYWKEGGTYNITTKQENARLEVFYDGKPDSYIQDGGVRAYREVGIELVDDSIKMGL